MFSLLECESKTFVRINLMFAWNLFCIITNLSSSNTYCRRSSFRLLSWRLLRYVFSDSTSTARNIHFGPLLPRSWRHGGGRGQPPPSGSGRLGASHNHQPSYVHSSYESPPQWSPLASYSSVNGVNTTGTQGGNTDSRPSGNQQRIKCFCLAGLLIPVTQLPIFEPVLPRRAALPTVAAA